MTILIRTDARGAARIVVIAGIVVLSVLALPATASAHDITTGAYSVGGFLAAGITHMLLATRYPSRRWADLAVRARTLSSWPR